MYNIMKERENISLLFLKRKEQFTKISRKTVHKKNFAFRQYIREYATVERYVKYLGVFVLILMKKIKIPVFNVIFTYR